MFEPQKRPINGWKIGPQNWQKTLFLFLGLGVYLSFLGAYFSVSIIGIGTGLMLATGLPLLIGGKHGAVLKNNPLALPFGLLILAILLSIALADPYDFEKPLGKVRYLFCFFFFTWYFVVRPGDTDIVLAIIRRLVPLLGGIALLQFFGVFSPLPYFGGPPSVEIIGTAGKYFHASGFAFHHNPFSLPLALLFQVLLAHWLFNDAKNRNAVFGVPLVFAAAGIFCSFSRSAWLATAFSTLSVLFLKDRKLVLKIGAVLGALLIGSCLVFAPFRERVLSIRPSQNPERLELWRVGVEMLKDAPVFGQGFYSFGSRVKNYTDHHLTNPHFPVEVHNMYLDMLCGTGLVGFAAFLFLIFSILKMLRNAAGQARAPNDRAWAIGIWGGFLAFLVAGIFDKHFYMTQSLVPNLFFWGIGAALATKES